MFAYSCLSTHDIILVVTESIYKQINNKNLTEVLNVLCQVVGIVTHDLFYLHQQMQGDTIVCL